MGSSAICEALGVTAGSIPALVNRVERVLVAKRLDEKLDGAGFYCAQRDRHVTGAGVGPAESLLPGFDSLQWAFSNGYPSLMAIV